MTNTYYKYIWKQEAQDPYQLPASSSDNELSSSTEENSSDESETDHYW